MTTCPVFDSPEALRICKKATEEAWRELDNTPRHLLDPGNPNHPSNFNPQLFGYDQDTFLAKQYK